MGFIGGTSWSNFGLLIPYRNDRQDNYNQRSQHGRLVRFDMEHFDLGECQGENQRLKGTERETRPKAG